jgi:hypothetical protein
MSSKLYFLNFEGYWRENEISTIPKISGVYCVYACTYNPESNSVSLRSLLYIGGADDVCDSIAKTEKLPEWRKHLQQGEELCFNMAAVDPPEIPRVQAGLVFHHKPNENSEYIDSFPFEPTTVIKTSGRNHSLDELCVVHKTMLETSLNAYTEEAADLATKKTELQLPASEAIQKV